MAVKCFTTINLHPPTHLPTQLTHLPTHSSLIVPSLYLQSSYLYRNFRILGEMKLATGSMETMTNYHFQPLTLSLLPTLSLTPTHSLSHSYPLFLSLWPNEFLSFLVQVHICLLALLTLQVCYPRTGWTFGEWANWKGQGLMSEGQWGGWMDGWRRSILYVLVKYSPFFLYECLINQILKQPISMILWIYYYRFVRKFGRTCSPSKNHRPFAELWPLNPWPSILRMLICHWFKGEHCLDH